MYIYLLTRTMIDDVGIIPFRHQITTVGKTCYLVN